MARFPFQITLLIGYFDSAHIQRGWTILITKQEVEQTATVDEIHQVIDDAVNEMLNTREGKYMGLSAMPLSVSTMQLPLPMDSFAADSDPASEHGN